MGIADGLADLLGGDLPIAIDAYDGSHTGPSDARATLVLRSPNALRRVMTAPNDLGIGRAFVAGELDLEGDIYEALKVAERLPDIKFDAPSIAKIARMIDWRSLGALKPLSAPPEEIRLHGRKHTKARDEQAVAHHYDVSNEFYRIVLGPTMTYSCAVWDAPDVGLDAAQDAKHDLVCRKLALRPGMRLLDIGCGWGSMAMHAARHYGVHVVGVTLSDRQAQHARERVEQSGVADLVEIRKQDYRDVRDGPYEAISSIGMFEHVGLEQLDRYFACAYALLRPGGRFLNHAISRPPAAPANLRQQLHLQKRHGPVRGFLARYVFPDGELHEVGQVISGVQRAGFEARHCESLREHYALTLRAWVDNLEASLEPALTFVTPGRLRVWRLYMAASAMNFEQNRTQVHQVLAVRPDGGRSGMGLRPDW